MIPPDRKILDMVYPIGSIYMSVNNINPSKFFGGTWDSWGSGRVPVGVDTSDSDFKTAEKEGGTKTHSLTIAQMPSHNHIFSSGKAESSGAHIHSLSGGINSTPLTGTANFRDADSSTSTIMACDGVFSDKKTNWSGNHAMYDFTMKAGSYSVLEIDASHSHGHNLSINSNGNHEHNVTGSISNTGSGEAFNIEQPYITCYMWKRIA